MPHVETERNLTIHGDFRRALQRMAVMDGCARIFAESSSVQDASEKILEFVGRQLGCFYGAYWSRQSHVVVLRREAVWTESSKEGAAFGGFKRRRLCKLGLGIIGRAWARKDAVWASDPLIEELKHEGFALPVSKSSGCAIPVMDADEFLGSIEFYGPFETEAQLDVTSMLLTIGTHFAQFIGRLRARDALKISEARKVAVLESAIDSILSFNHEAIIEEANSSAETTFGCNRKEMVGASIVEDFVPESQRDDFLSRLSRCLEASQGETSHQFFETRLKRADGGEFPAEVGMNRIHLDGHTSITACLRDITKRKRAEVELYNSRNELDSILKGIADSIIVRDLEDRVIYVNPQGAEYLGVAGSGRIAPTKAGVLTRFEVMDLEDRLLNREDFPSASIIAGDVQNKEAVFKFRARGSSDQPRWAAIKSAPIFDRDNKLSMVVTIFRDITESKLAEAEIRNSHSLLSTVIESASDGILVKDLQGRILIANASAARLLGRPSSDLTGRLIREILPSDMTAEWLTPNSDELEREGCCTSESTLAVNGIFRTYLCTHSAYRDTRGNAIGILCTLKDITERKRAEEAAHFLAEASQVLSSSLDVDTTLSSMAWLAVPALADWCCIDLLDEAGRLRPLGMAHQQPSTLSLIRNMVNRWPFNLESPHGAGRVVQSGQSEMVPDISDKFLAEFSLSAEHEAVLRCLGLRSYMSVPLVSRGRILGAISLASLESGRRFTSDDLALGEELGRRAGLAVDNARLYSESQRMLRLAESARQKFNLQAKLSTLVASGAELERLLPEILRSLGEALGCWQAAFWAADDASGTQWPRAYWRSESVHAEPSSRVDPDALKRIFKTGVSECVPTTEGCSYLVAFPGGGAVLGLLEFQSGASAISSEYLENLAWLSSIARQLGAQSGVRGTDTNGREEAAILPVAYGDSSGAFPQPDDLTIDPVSFTVGKGVQRSVALTSKEFQILMLLHQSVDRCRSRSELVNSIWGKMKVSANSLDVHLFNLRRKLAPLGFLISFSPPNVYRLTS